MKCTPQTENAPHLQSGVQPKPSVSLLGFFAIKTPDFDKKSGVFLAFWHKMEPPKILVGLAVGLTPKKGVLESGVFQTLLQIQFSGRCR